MKSHPLPARYCAPFAMFFLCSQALAGSGKEDAVRALDQAEAHLRSGAVITADIVAEQKEAPESLERSYFSGDRIRVDTIIGYEPGKLLVSPTVTVTIFTPNLKMSGQVILRETYKNPEAIFAKLLRRPSPEIRLITDVPNIAAATPQVLGYTGSVWLSDRLRSASDGAMKAVGNTKVITWGAHYPFTTDATLRQGFPLIDSYVYRPNVGNAAFYTFEIKRDPGSHKDAPVYNFASTASYGDTRYKLTIQKAVFGPVKDSIFKYDESEHSLIIENGAKDVYTIVNGKRVKNYSQTKQQQAASTSSTPIAILLLGALATFVAFVLAWLRSRAKNSSR